MTRNVPAMLETNDKRVRGLCLVGRRAKGGKYETWVVKRADSIRGLSIDFVVWFREPSQDEMAVVLPALR